MANNDWYKPHEKDVVMALKKGKAAPREAAVSCSMMRMKDGAHFICAHISPPKAAGMVKEARTAAGKVVAAGRLFAGADGPTFEIDSGSLSVKQKFSTAAAGLGCPMSVLVVAAPGAILDSDETAGAAPPAPPAPPAKTSPAAPPGAPPAPAVNIAAVRAALTKLIPVVQQAVKDHPDQKNALLPPLTRCQQHIKDNQPVEANAALKEVADRVKALSATPAAGQAAAPAADKTAAPPSAPPAATGDIAAVRAALAKLVPAVQQAVKAHPDQKNELLQPLARCQQHIKDNQPVEAKALVVEVARRVKALTAAPAGGAPAAQEIPKETGASQAPEIPKGAGAAQPAQEKSQETPAGPNEFKELYDGLLETIPGDLRRYRQADPAAAAQIQKVIDGAAARAAKGDYQKAFSFLNRAAEVIAKAAGAGRVKEAAEVIPEGKVAAMKAALSSAKTRWNAALATAQAGIKPFQALLAPEFPTEAAGVARILESYWKDLADAILAGEALDGAGDLDGAVKATLRNVETLRAEVLGDPLFSYLDECGMPVRPAFVAAFNDVDKLLRV